MFDPLQAFSDSAGRRVNLHLTTVNSPDQLTSFGGLPVPFPSSPDEFDGTVIRCPLRTKASSISSKVVHPVDITHLFQEFISEEIGICLLFLRHIQHIEIHDINEQGETTVVADLTISRSLPVLFEDDDAETYTAVVKMQARDQETEKSWRILHSRSDQQEIIQLLGKDGISETLKKHKLLPDIGIAVPSSITTKKETSGRLFTFLPLPVPTHFPAHIHAYFALSQSRQNLRNSSEIGLVPGTDDQYVWTLLCRSRHRLICLLVLLSDGMNICLPVISLELGVSSWKILLTNMAISKTSSMHGHPSNHLLQVEKASTGNCYQ